VAGTINADGEDGYYGQGSSSYGSGGGAGGSIYLNANDLELGANQVTALAGQGYNAQYDGGNGSVGRIRLDYAPGGLSGATDPYPGYIGEGTFDGSSSAPNRPVNGDVSPDVDGTKVSLTPTLHASEFSDPDGDVQQDSRWQIRKTDGSYGDADSYEAPAGAVTNHSLSINDI
jgi:hypothetical protein